MGFLDKILRRGGSSNASDEKDGPILGVLILRSADYPLKNLARLLEKQPIFGRAIQFGRDEANSTTYTANLSPGTLAMAIMPGPYPWKDLQGPCQTAWSWPAGTSAMICQQGQAFLLITLVGDKGSRIARRQYLTQIMAKATQSDMVLGVYWPEGTLVHHPKLFRELAGTADSPDVPALHLWIDYRLYKNPDRSIGLFTTGMRGIGLMEMEIPVSDMPPEELRDWAMNITAYQLENGPVMKDGQTLGPTQRASFLIRYRPSRFGHEGLIMGLDPMS